MTIGTTSDQVRSALERSLMTTTLDEAVTSRDVFQSVPLEEGLESVERDRVFVTVIINGPDRVPGSTCLSRIRGAIRVRYYNAPLSRARMERDIPIVFAALRRARTLEPMLSRVTVSGPTFEYNAIEASAVANFFFNADFRQVVIR